MTRLNLNKKKGSFIALLFLLTSTAAFSQSGGVGLNTTRVVFMQDNESVSVGARNRTDINYLAKFNVSVTTNSNQADAPFIVTPPLVKINSGATQDIKIYTKPHNFPSDRESLYYFSATMIPATKGPTEGSALNIGYRNIIKLFYRPNDLKMTPKEAQQQLKIKKTASGITVINDSPYYISLNNLSVNGVNALLDMTKKNTMIAPFNSFDYSMPVNGRSGIAKWTVINDLGGEDVYDKQVN